MYDYTLFQVTKEDMSQMKWAVSLMTADGHFDLLHLFVWARMVLHPHFTITKGWFGWFVLFNDTWSQ